MRSIVLLLILLTPLLLFGCQEREKIVIGILPIEDSLPIVVAKDENLFSRYGLEIEVVNFNSALERDAALMAGKVDAVITDPLAVLILRSKGYDVKIVTLCLGKKPDEGVFAILASPNSSISEIKDLNGKEIAISSNTIIEYVTDELLSKFNVSYRKLDVKQIPIRLRMLLDNKVELATLPEPLATYAQTKGAKLIISDAMINESITQTVIVFRGDVVKRKPEKIEKFLECYAEAVRRINTNPEKYKEDFYQLARIPKDIAKFYKIPKYPLPQKLPVEFYERYLNWALNKKLILKPIPYESVVYDQG